MGLLDFLSGKSKAAPAPAGATDTTAAPAEELKKEIANHGLDASKIDIKVDGNKVTLSGTAPTTDEAEKIVLAVGHTKGVAQVENNIVAVKADAESKFYVVQAGDTLQKIAEAQYGPGKGGKYEEIFDANKPLLTDPDHIYPGQRLRIPGVAPDRAARAAPGAAAAANWRPPEEISKKTADAKTEGTVWKSPTT
jgi:nucleoid-associated protein YgaU